jgi:alanine racemase
MPMPPKRPPPKRKHAAPKRHEPGVVQGEPEKTSIRPASESEAGGIVTIDLGAIAANWRELKERAAPAECAAVVKADGYGCGIERVTAALAKAGCTTFFVAHIAEGRRARAVAPDTTIYVLNGLMPGAAASYAEANLRPVLGSRQEFADWQAFLAATHWSGGAALHVDTGMNRLGLSFEEAQDAALRAAGITLVMSHLACAETPDHPLNARQMAAFRAVRAMFPSIPASLANSSGIFLGPDAHHEMVRPGVALFGVNPTPGHANPMEPAIELRGRVLQVRNVEDGETVGYDATWTANRSSRIAIISIGYADGLLRSASATDSMPGAEAMVAGRRCYFAGLISMDLLAVDVTDLPEGTPRRGDLATLIGDGITVDDLAARAGTIGYEILTGLGKRYLRRYKES